MARHPTASVHNVFLADEIPAEIACDRERHHDLRGWEQRGSTSGEERVLSISRCSTAVFVGRGSFDAELLAKVGETRLELGDGLGTRHGQFVGSGRPGGKRRRQLAALCRELPFELRQLGLQAFPLLAVRDEVGFVASTAAMAVTISRRADLGQFVSRPFEVARIAVSLGGELVVRRSFARDDRLPSGQFPRVSPHRPRRFANHRDSNRDVVPPIHGRSAVATPRAFAAISGRLSLASMNDCRCSRHDLISAMIRHRSRIELQRRRDCARPGVISSVAFRLFVGERLQLLADERDTAAAHRRESWSGRSSPARSLRRCCKSHHFGQARTSFSIFECSRRN